MTRNRILGGLAIIFGIMTIFSGGMVLFGPDDARDAAGAVVPLVLWFNFASGFIYVAAGIGVFLAMRWGRFLAFVIAAALAVVMAAFGWHILSGEAWEVRTLAALTLRLAFWIAVATLARIRLARNIAPTDGHGSGE